MTPNPAYDISSICSLKIKSIFDIIKTNHIQMEIIFTIGCCHSITNCRAFIYDNNWRIKTTISKKIFIFLVFNTSFKKQLPKHVFVFYFQNFFEETVGQTPFLFCYFQYVFSKIVLQAFKPNYPIWRIVKRLPCSLNCINA